MTAATGTFDVTRVRADFPALHQDIHGKRLAFLDTAASAQTPQPVLDAMAEYYARDRANIHRGVYAMSQRATAAYEQARADLAVYLNAPSPQEVLFTRGTTESINLVAQSWGRANLQAGDAVMYTTLEHHSNLVPWQLLQRELGIELRAVPVSDAGELDLDWFHANLDGVKLLAVGHVSNALGTINPVKEMAAAAHARGAIVVVDGAQGPPHLRVDLQDLDADFYAFSGHKMFGPTGIGGLYGKRALLEAMPVWHGGGDMIRSVRLDGFTEAGLPAKFEAGTPNIAGGIGLGATARYLRELDFDAAMAHEAALVELATAQLSAIDGVRIVGTASAKAGVVSFVMEQAHPHDIGTVLDQHGVAVRAGHHCAQPLMERLGVPATTRASFAFYNTREDVDQLTAALREVVEIFG